MRNKMNFISEKIRVTTEKLFAFSNIKLRELTDVEYVKADGYKTDNTPPSDNWEPFYEGMRVHGSDGHFWFRLYFKTPNSKPDTSEHKLG